MRPSVIRLALIAVAVCVMLSSFEAEAVFFLDLLCASRIENLEKQVSQLVSLAQATTNAPISNG